MSITTPVTIRYTLAGEAERWTTRDLDAAFRFVVRLCHLGAEWAAEPVCWATATRLRILDTALEREVTR